MVENKWELVITVSGELQADLIRSLLEAQDIEVFLNQEGADANRPERQPRSHTVGIARAAGAAVGPSSATCGAI